MLLQHYTIALSSCAMKFANPMRCCYTGSACALPCALGLLKALSGHKKQLLGTMLSVASGKPRGFPRAHKREARHYHFK